MKPLHLMAWIEVDCSPAARRGQRGRSRGSRPWSGAVAPPPSPSTEATLQWWGSTYRAYFNHLFNKLNFVAFFTTILFWFKIDTNVKQMRLP